MFEVVRRRRQGTGACWFAGNVPVHVPVVGQPLLKPGRRAGVLGRLQPGTQLAGSVAAAASCKDARWCRCRYFKAAVDEAALQKFTRCRHGRRDRNERKRPGSQPRDPGATRWLRRVVAGHGEEAYESMVALIQRLVASPAWRGVSQDNPSRVCGRRRSPPLGPKAKSVPNARGPLRACGGGQSGRNHGRRHQPGYPGGSIARAAAPPYARNTSRAESRSMSQPPRCRARQFAHPVTAWPRRIGHDSTSSLRAPTSRRSMPAQTVAP